MIELLRALATLGLSCDDDEIAAQADVARRAADRHTKGARFDDPGHTGIAHLELFAGDGERDLATFAGRQADSLESDELH